MNNLIMLFLHMQKKMLINILVSPCLFFIFLNSATAGTSSHTITFQAKFIPGSCDITVNPPSINWGAVLASDIKQAGETGIQAKDITVTYANCSGLGISPKLSVTGGTFTAGIPLFSDTDAATDSDARGYGVRLVHKGNMDTPLDNEDVVPVGQPGMQLGDLNGTESGFSASLSCGSNCGGTTLRNGDLKARVTFTFLYE